MFTFHRDWLATGTVEAWKILLQEDRTADGSVRFEERFGPSLIMRLADDMRYYDLGFLVAIPIAQDGKERIKYFLACKDGLTEEEKATLLREMELLLGKFTHAAENEGEQGWFLHDELVDVEPSRRDATG
jgi:hypothetical protein